MDKGLGNLAYFEFDMINAIFIADITFNASTSHAIVYCTSTVNV